MPKFQKPNQYRDPRPSEMPAVQPEEAATPGPAEAPTVKPKEAPARRVCGINGCTTWYDDPKVMKRHYERQHGIGGPPNLNQPKPRNPEVKLA